MVDDEITRQLVPLLFDYCSTATGAVQQMYCLRMIGNLATVASATVIIHELLSAKREQFIVLVNFLVQAEEIFVYQEIIWCLGNLFTSAKTEIQKEFWGEIIENFVIPRRFL